MNGNWGEWTAWGSCSRTCGSGGMKHRSRACNAPAPQQGGLSCAGSGHETMKCSAPVPCPGKCHYIHKDMRMFFKVHVYGNDVACCIGLHIRFGNLGII